MPWIEDLFARAVRSRVLCDGADGERETLTKIDDAFKRINDSSYGDCQECGKKITKKRLKVVPHAENCKICQEKEESEKRS